MTAFKATADLASLPAIRDFVLGKAKEANIPITLEPKLDLVLEEVLVNIATHAYEGKAGDIEVECTAAPDAFCCSVRDKGAPFNPLQAEAPDLTTDIDARPIGGLGLMFVTTMSDDCTYTRDGDANVLTFCFSL